MYSGGTTGAGCKGDKATIPSEGCVVEWYSNYTHIPGEPTIPPKSPLLTYQDACMSGHEVQHCCTDECQDPAAQAKGGACEGCDWSRKNPWRAPGSAPVFSPCGFDGGNPQGCPVGHPGTDGCGGGGYGHGPDGRSFPGNHAPVYWEAGKTAEVSWGFAANHGGGYSYRLCPKPANNMDLTEECFQRIPLNFAGTHTILQKLNDKSSRIIIPAMQTDTGTTPPGSQWRRVPVPACIGTGGGSNPAQANCTIEGGGTGETQFPPPAPGIEGFHSTPWNIIDLVEVPTDISEGDYVISYRYDCEQTPQVWQQCGDVRITNQAPPPLDQCDNPACASCCGEGTCSNCRGWCEDHPDYDTCAGCYKESPGAPPCNLRGTACMNTDGLGCEACWSPKALPAGFRAPFPAFLAPEEPVSTWVPTAPSLVPKVAPALAVPVSKFMAPKNETSPNDFCRTDVPQCESCCTGSCTGCRGYCEGTKAGDCIHCWTGAEGAPMCNMRGTQCLADDGLSCELCWTPPASEIM